MILLLGSITDLRDGWLGVRRLACLSVLRVTGGFRCEGLILRVREEGEG